MKRHGLTDDEYADLPGLRATWLKTLWSRTPAHLLHAMQASEDSEALALGRALHVRVLQPSVYEAGFAVAPKLDRRTKEGKAAFEAFTAQAAGRTVLTEAESQQVEDMARAIDGTNVRRLLELCDEREVVLDGWVAGQLCKCRIDACSASDGLLIDVKTTISASPRAFTRSVVEYGYLLQAAFYRRLMRLHGYPDGATVLVAVEKHAPHAVALYALSSADVDRMDGEIDALIARYTDCVCRNEWPGYPAHVQTLELPAWAFGNANNDTMEVL